MKKGYVQVYTGEGKGKTTAALGLVLRAVGAGLRVCIIQFCKGRICSEHAMLKKMGKLITVHQFGRRSFIYKTSDVDAACAQAAFAKTQKEIKSGQFDLVVLDEINVAMSLGLVNVNDVIALLKERPVQVEVVCTGRGAPKKIVVYGDLVTEMRCVKHYYQKGVGSRKGIEQ